MDLSISTMLAKSYRQKEGLDYFDTYSPVTRITSIRMLIAIAVLDNLDIHQMDVKTAFLNGDLGSSSSLHTMDQDQTSKALLAEFYTE